MVYTSLFGGFVLGAGLGLCRASGAGDVVAASVLFGVLLVWLLYASSFIVIRLFAEHGVMALLYVSFGLTGVRMIAALLLGSLAMRVWTLSGPALAASLAASYLPLLALEVTLVIRHVKAAGATPPGAEVTAT